MAKQGLNQHGNLKTKLVSFVGEEENVKREKEEEEEEEEKRKEEESIQASQGMELWIFGMEITLKYEFCMDHMEFPCFDGYYLAQI